MYHMSAMLGYPSEAELMAMVVRKVLPFALILAHTIPIILALVLLNKYFFKSAEGIDGALGG